MTPFRRLPDPSAVPFVSIAEAGDYLGMSTRTAYRAAGRGTLATVLVGQRRRVPTTELYRIRDVPLPHARPTISAG